MKPKREAGRLPNFVIIGAMRSGTTALARYLGAHPDAFMAPAKEIHYFDKHFERGSQWYKEQFAGVSGEHAVGEATQTYMYQERAISRMATLLPDSRLLAILRNPVDRAYSHYWHNRARGRETLEFAEAISAEPSRLAGGRYGAQNRYSYVARGSYLEQLVRVCRFYPRESLLVLTFEALRDSPSETYRLACNFLGIDVSFVPRILGKPVNSYVSFRSRAVRNASRRLPKLFRNAVGRVNTRSGGYPPMDPEVRAELEARFEGQNAALSEWLERDLSEWRS